MTTPSDQSPLLCWRSAFAGLFLTILIFATIASLSIAFGGISVEDGEMKNVGLYAGISVITAMIVATFVGSLYSVRVAKIKYDVVGVMQGLLVGSLFIVLVLCQALSVVGDLGKATGQALGIYPSVLTEIQHSNLIREIIEDNMGDFNLRSSPGDVVHGVTSRLLRGDQESAKLYLALQANVSPTEADQKIASAKIRIDELSVKANETMANALKASGWSLFVALVLTTVASVLGGALGAVLNARHQLDSE